MYHESYTYIMSTSQKIQELCQDRETCRLATATGGIIQSLGEVTFPRERAISLVKDLVKKYYGEYQQFLNVLDNFLSNAVKLYRVLNEP